MMAPAAATTQPQAESLNVIALISGGKDSFFSLLHCRENGHRVVALANLYPPTGTGSRAVSPTSSVGDGTAPPGNGEVPEEKEEEEEEDLNSHMYQTVGHSVIPLYAAATGIPLYRKAISSFGATQRSKDYSHYVSTPEEVAERKHDETESMFYLLKGIKARHPEANAVCAGAILSTYQRTRVESVAVRLGLTPLAYLWKFPVLPSPTGDDGQLLLDMEQAGLEARIIKVASGGLGEEDLWVNVASAKGKNKVEKGMKKFSFGEGLDGGAVIGEGGEFETLVVNGPGRLFRKRIVVEEEGRRVVREGGGTAWLSLRDAKLEDKEELYDGKIRVPGLLDKHFEEVLEALPVASEEPSTQDLSLNDDSNHDTPALDLDRLQPANVQHLVFMSADHPSIQDETTSITALIEAYLGSQSLPSTVTLSTTILLRQMSDFGTINPIYGSLFPFPNPPSRVCISCGNLLPEGINIVIALALALSTSPDVQRDGLHVQSRSYWAPANIGPYSQAITTPLFSGSAVKAVRIAGQIPLIPATMALPPPEDINLQLVLSLQHLFRVGVETGVQLFTSGVAFFSASSSPDGMPDKARLAGKVWELAHGKPKNDDDEDEDEDDDGPDIWDRKYNSQYTSFASGGGQAQNSTGPQLPDWGVMSTTKLAPVFVAEVEELPRGSGVEWQGHLGIGGASEGGVQMIQRGNNIWQAVVEDRFVQTIVAERSGEEDDGAAKLIVKGLKERGLVPVVTYVNGGCKYQVGEEERGLVVPCRSLWDGKGRKVGIVRIWEGVIGDE
ncbi:putative ribonuclease [Triangularia verruculosa]|uniref:Diphthine--ammonia ligase n=1 Tax=Triangularia verruculosa TaxID=2587418 RepID=A0AAN6XP39_9PEZI|nr:putative ribonuclease [Triangularia verruculosa]